MLTHYSLVLQKNKYIFALKKDGTPIKEDESELLPVTSYGVSKVAQELLGKQFFFAHGVKSIILRYFFHSL